MKQIQGNYYFCKTTKLFKYLVKNDCDFVRTVENKTHRGFNAYLFLVNDNLKKSLTNYYTNKTDRCIIPTVSKIIKTSGKLQQIC